MKNPKLLFDQKEEFELHIKNITFLMDDIKKAFLMEPYLQLGRSTMSPFFFARDGSIRNVFKFHIKDI